MNKDGLKSLSEKTREDGKRLFGVCEFIYNLAMIGIFIVAILGIIGTIGLIVNEQIGAAIAIAVIVFIICFINYMVAVLTTHVGKVLVHTSFASIGILEYITAREEKEI